MSQVPACTNRERFGKDLSQLIIQPITTRFYFVFCTANLTDTTDLNWIISVEENPKPPKEPYKGCLNAEAMQQDSNQQGQNNGNTR